MILSKPKIGSSHFQMNKEKLQSDNIAKYAKSIKASLSNVSKEIVFNSVSERRPPGSVCERKCSGSASLFIIQSTVVFILLLTSVVCNLLSRNFEKNLFGLRFYQVWWVLFFLFQDKISKTNNIIPTEDLVFMSMVDQQHLESPT